MNLPYLQLYVDDSRRHGQALAVKAKARGIKDQLRLDASWWRGKLEDVWDFGVKASGDRRPDGVIRGDDAAELLRAAIHYPGGADELQALLTDVGLLEKSRAGLRIKGVDELYGPAWDRSNVRKDRASKAAKARWNDAQSMTQASPKHGRGNAKTEKEKKTETETEKKIDQIKQISSEQEVLPGMPPPVVTPTPPRATSITEDSAREFQELRKDKFEELGLDYEPDEKLEYGFVMAAIKRLRSFCESESELFDLFDEYLAQPWAANYKPPFPLKALASDKVYPKLLAAIRKEQTLQ